jgi:hypothetical protein
MEEERVINILAAHADEITDHPGAMQQANVTDEESSELISFFELAQQLEQNLQPIQPSAAFVRSLGKELMEQAKHQMAVRERRRRTMVIGAATVGSIVSIASVVGAIVYVIIRSRTRARAVQA